MANLDLHSFRRNFTAPPLLESETPENPFFLFKEWISEALNTPEILDPHSASLATCINNKPSARIILIKSFSETDGFTFYTNYESRKCKELLENPNSHLLFYWDKLHKQVRVEGTVKKVSKKQSETYFHSRPFDSQIMASISKQSTQTSRDDLHKSFDEMTQKYQNKKVPLPKNWGGLALSPTYFEFWQGRPSRLHDRISFKKEKNKWTKTRLAP